MSCKLSHIIKSVKILPIIFFLSLILLLSGSVLSKTSISQPRVNYQENKIYTYELNNGLNLIIKEDHKSPIVTIYTLVKTGSADENRFYGCGISHFIEHMLFKGTKKYKNGEIHKVIKSLGGNTNGFTSLDYTGYYITVPKENFNKVLNIMSDILQNAAFRENDFNREKEVILKEINMTKDNPENAVLRNLWSKAFIVHPYRHPVIGYRALFLQLKRDDLIHFYHKRYKPNNIILSIGGDISQKEVYSDVDKLFSKFEPAPYYIEAGLTSEPEQQTKRISIKRKDVQLGYLALGFKGVNITSDDLYALDLLANILGKGRSSRVTMRLKNELKIVYSIDCYNYTPRYKGLFIVTATLDGKNLDKAIEGILEEINNIKEDGITKEELEKAKNTTTTNYLNHLQTIESQTQDLASSLYLTGDAKFTYQYLNRINKQKEEDIRKVAMTYLLSDKLTISVILPEVPPSKKNQKIEKKEIDKYPVKKIVLSNGVTLLLKEDRSSPLVDIQAIFKGGLRYENENTNGICNLMTQLFLKGTKNYTRDQLNRLLEKRGIRTEIFSQNNSFGMSINLLSKDIDFALQLLSEILINPTFKESQIVHEKQLIKASIQRQKDDLFQYGFLTLRKNFFENHPYRLNPLGSVKSLSKINRADILAFYEKVARPSNLTLAVFGDIQTKQIINLVERYFSNFGEGEKNQVKINLPKDNYRRGRNAVSKIIDKNQALIMIGFSAPSNTDHKKYAFEILDSMLSGSGSRLFYNLRDKKGLAYQVGTFSMMGFEPGCWIFYIATTKDLIAESEKALIEQIKKIKKYDFSKDEINEAKRSLMGRHYIKLQTNKALSFKCALDEMYNLGYDNHKNYRKNIREVTEKDIKSAINEFLDLNNYTIVILRPRN